MGLETEPKGQSGILMTHGYLHPGLMLGGGCFQTFEDVDEGFPNSVVVKFAGRVYRLVY
jgi:hypothetical protein